MRLHLAMTAMVSLAACEAPQQGIPLPQEANSTAATQTDANPHVVFAVAPIYPAEAQGKSGHVDLAFIVEPDGSVADIRVTDEVPRNIGFAEAATRALARWKFSPKFVGGLAVAGSWQTRLNFNVR